MGNSYYEYWEAFCNTWQMERHKGWTMYLKIGSNRIKSHAGQCIGKRA